MIIVNYKSKRQLKKAIGETLKNDCGGIFTDLDGKPLFVTNLDSTFKATVVLADGKIESVR